MIVYDKIEQRTEEWLELRLGMVGGTSLSSLTGKLTTEGGLGAMDRMLFSIVAERDTGLRKDGAGKSAIMERGNEEEENTQDHFEISSGLTVSNVGFIKSEEFEMVGLSPDGVIYNEEGVIIASVEYKNPNSDTHLKYVCHLLGIQAYQDTEKLFTNNIPSEYYWQVVHNFVVIDTIEKVYFMSHDERSNLKKNIISVVTREELEDDIALAKVRLKMFEEKVKQVEAKLAFD